MATLVLLSLSSHSIAQTYSITLDPSTISAESIGTTIELRAVNASFVDHQVSGDINRKDQGNNPSLWDDDGNAITDEWTKHITLENEPTGLRISSIVVPRRWVGSNARCVGIPDDEYCHVVEMRLTYDGEPLTSTQTVKIVVSSSVLDFFDSDIGRYIGNQNQSNLSATLTITGSANVDPLRLSTNSLSVNEGSNTTYNVRLRENPGGGTNVTVTPTSSNPTKVSLSPSSLTFSGGGSGDWNTNKTVTVTGETDQDAKNETARISHAVSLPGRTKGSSIQVSVTDTGSAGVVISTSAIVIPNDDTTASYTIELSSQPSHPVTITGTIGGTHGTTVIREGSKSNTSATFTKVFTTSNWNLAQTVDLFRVDGVQMQGSATITHTSSSSDSDYNAISGIGSVAVTTLFNTVPRAHMNVSATSVSEGGSVTITASLVGGDPLSNAVAIPFTYTNGTAESTDYSGPGSITIAAGAFSNTGTVSITNDSIYEKDNETFTIALGSLPSTVRTPADAAFASKQITILGGDDDKPTASVTASSASIVEGTNNPWTVHLSNSSETGITVTGVISQVGSFVSASSIGNKNYRLSAGSTSFFPSVTIANDTTDEAEDGSATITLTSGSDYKIVDATKTSTVTITDNDPTTVELSVAAAAISEASGTKSITLTLGRALRANQSLSLPVTFAGTSVFGTDYSVTAPSPLPSGVTVSSVSANPITVTFTGSAGGSATNATLTLTATDDSVREGNETVQLSIPTQSSSSGTGLSGGASIKTGTQRTRSFTINDNETLPVVSISKPADVTEGSTDMEVHFPLSVNVASQQALTVRVNVSESSDFLDSANIGPDSLPFSAGVVKGEKIVDLIADSVDDPDGTVTVAITSDAAYTLGSTNTVTINVFDNDPTSVTLAAASGDISETGGTKAITITLGRGLVSGEVLTLPLTVGGAATLGTDYTLSCANATGVSCTTLTTTPTVKFTGGVTTSATTATLTLTATGDSFNEGASESVSINLPTLNVESGTGLSGGAKGSGSVAFNITDDDGASTITMSGDTTAITEGGSKTFTFTSTTANPTALTLGITVASSGSFLAATATGSKSLTLPAGSTMTTHTVSTLSDTTDEQDGSFTITFTGGTGYTHAGGPFTVQVNDDDATTVALTVPSGAIAEASGKKTLTVTLNRGLFSGETLPVSLNFTGTATFGTDYTLAAPSPRPNGVTYTNLNSSNLQMNKPRITFTGPASSTATIDLTATQDSLNEGAPETISVSLDTLNSTSGNVSGGASGSGSGTFSITDDDSGGTVSISGGSNVVEGKAIVFTVTNTSTSVSSLPVNLTVSETGDVLTSTELGSKSVSIPAGETTAKYTVNTSADTTDETNGTVTVAVASGTGYTAASGATGSQTVTVSDDDPTTVKLAVTDATAIEGSNSDRGQFTVTLGRSLTTGEKLAALISSSTTNSVAVTLELTPANGISLSGNTLTFTGGSSAAATATIAVGANDDNNFVSDSVSISLGTLTPTGLGGGVSGSGSGTIAIADKGAEAGVTIDTTNISMNEGESRSYTVVLDTDPGSAVTITPQSGDSTSITTDTASISFTSGVSGNWSVPQSVHITAENDGDTDNEIVTISHTVTGYSATAENVTVSVTDAGTGVVVDPVVLTVNPSETATFKVKLKSQPTASGDYLITSTSTDAGIATVGTPGAITQSSWNVGVDVTVAGVAEGTTTITNTAPSSGAPAPYDTTHDVPDVVVKVLASTTPVLTIAPDSSSVTEGGDAVFTVTSNPAVADSALPFTVSSTSTGEYGVTLPAESQSFAVGTSHTITVPTTGDAVDEVRGEVTVTLVEGDGYRLGATKSASIVLVDDDTTAVTLAGSGSIAETGGEASITVTLGRALVSGESLSVPLSFGGAATFTTDYTLAAPAQVPKGVTFSSLNTSTPSINFAGGTGFANASTLRILAAHDTSEETNESISVGLGTLNSTSGVNLDGGASSSGSASFTITDDDSSGPTISISAGGAVSEGSAAVFTVTANPSPSGNLDVKLSIGQSGDFVSSGLGTQTVTVPVSGSVNHSVPTQNDSTDEANGSVTATVLAGTGYSVGSSSVATRSITDDDATSIGLSAPSGNIGEAGGTKSLSVTLGRALVTGEKLVVHLAFGGGATLGTDYSLTAPNPQPSGVTYGSVSSSPVSVTFTGGSGSARVATLALTATNDASVEGNETVTVGMNPPSETGLNGGTSSSGSVSFSILDDDDTTLPKVSISGGSDITEGANATYTLSVPSAVSAALVVNYTVSETGNWVSGTNIGAKTATIPANGTSVGLTVATQDDSTDEIPGSVTVTINSSSLYAINPAQAQAIVGVIDNDKTTATLSVAAGNIPEAGGSKNISVQLSRSLQNGEAIEVELDFGGAATYGTDYTIAGTPRLGLSYSSADPATMTFTGSTTASPVLGSFILSATNDSADEGQGENVSIEISDLSAVSGSTGLDGGVGSAGGGGIKSFLITDDDGSPVVSIEGGTKVTEGSKAQFTLSSSSAVGLDTTINLTVSESASFVNASNEGSETQTISMSSDTATFEVQTVGDTTDEMDGTVTVVVTAGNNYIVSSSKNTASVDVEDNDATTVTLTVPDATATEKNSSDAARIVITTGRALVSGESIQVPLVFSGSGGTLGTDFTLMGDTSAKGVSYDNAKGIATFSGQDGASQAATFTLTESDDVDETADTLSVALGTLAPTGLSGGATKSGTATHTITLTDAGAQPAVDIAPLTLTVMEGSNTGQYMVKLHTDPGGSVTVTPASLDPARLTVSGALTFNSGNWSVNQPVTVTSLLDGDTANNIVKISHSVSGYGTITSGPEVTINITDPGHGVTVSESTLSVAEQSSVTYSIRLNSQPTSSVTITPSSSDDAVATVSGPLTFLTSRWSTAQLVTVTGIVHSGTPVTVSHAISSTDPSYAGQSVSDVTVTVTPIPRIQVSTNSITAAEDGNDGTYTVWLNTAPSGNVTVTPQTTSSKISFPDGALTFTPGNWPNPQTVTVRANLDTDINDETATITHSVSGYGSVVSGPTISVSVTDVRYRIWVDVEELTVNLAQSKNVPIRLSTQPQDLVIVTGQPYEISGGCSGTLATDKLSLNTGTVTFSSTSPLTQNLNYTGAIPTAGEIQLCYTVSASDPKFKKAVTGGPTPVTVVGRDHVVVTPRGVGMEEGETATYEVYLVSDPEGTATVTPTSNNPAIATVSDALQFDSSNYSIRQTVTVTGVADANTVSDTTSITHTVSGYGSVTSAASVAVTVDESSARVIINPLALTTKEGESKTYQVSLATDPGAITAIVTPVSGDETVLTVSGPLSFTSSNFSETQDVTVTGVTDANAVEDTATITHTVTGYRTITSGPNVEVTVAEADAVIEDPDVKVDLSISSSSITEGQAALDLTATLESSNESGGTLSIPIEVKTADTTALANDYTFASSIDIAADESSGTTSLTITDDIFDELEETLTIQLGGTLPDGVIAGTTTEVSLTITDNDPTGVVLGLSDSTATEGDSSETAQITVTISRGLVAGETLTVPLSFSGGTLGTDFTLSQSASLTGITVATATGVVSFTGGNTPSDRSVLIELTVPDEATDDFDDEEITVSLGTLTSAGMDGGASGSRTGDGKITVTDDDTAPATTVSISVGKPGAEGDSSFRDRLVTVSATGDAGSISVDVCVSGGTATFDPLGGPQIRSGIDYWLRSSTKGAIVLTTVGTRHCQSTFVSSNTDEEYYIRAFGDTEVEPDETVIMELVRNSSTPSNVAISTSAGSATYIIVNDDGVDADVVLSVPSLTIGIDDAQRSYQVKLKAQPADDVVIDAFPRTAAAACVSCRLTFTRANWNLDQTVSIRGQVPDTTIAVEHHVQTGDEGAYETGATLPTTLEVIIVGGSTAPTLNLSFSASSIEEGGSSADFVATLVGVSETTSVDFSDLLSFSGTGVTSSDYSVTGLPTGSVSFSAPGYSNEYAVTASDDSLDESNETLEVTFDTVPSTIEAGNTASIVLVDQDPTSVTLARVGSGDLTEGDSTAAELTVTLGRTLAGSESISVPLNVASTRGSITSGDYAIALKSGNTLNTGVTLTTPGGTPTLTFTSGASVATIELTASSDSVTEADGETLTLSLGSVTSNLDRASGTGTSGTSASGSVAINIVDGVVTTTIVLSVESDGDITEGGDASFTVSATPAPTEALAITFTLSQEGEFVTASDLGAGKTETIAANDSEVTVTVGTLADVVDEPNGSVTLVLTPSGDYDISATEDEAEVAVEDDDATTVELEVTDATATEGDDDATATIDVTLSRALVSGETLNVPLTFSGGAIGTEFGLVLSAATGVSFASATSTLTFRGGVSAADAAELILSGLADADSDDETITVSLGSLTSTGLGGEATGSRTGDGVIEITDPGVVGAVVIAGSPLSVTEGGDDGEYTVVLATDPGTSVTVTPTGDDDAAVSISGALTFTSSNWDDPQPVTVTALPDGNIISESVTITHSVTGYGGVDSAPDATVNVIDLGRGISIEPVSLSFSAGETESYVVVLLSEPDSAVTVTPDSGDEGIATVSTGIAFSPSGWDTPLEVEVTGVSAGSTSITHTVTSSDTGYSAISPSAVSVSVTATAGVTASATEVDVSERGDEVTYTLVLNTNPNATVTITPSSADTSAVGVSGPLTFTASTWNIPQDVTLTAPPDADTDSETVTISHSVSGYSGVTTAPSVEVDVDDFGAVVLVEPSTVSLAPGETQAYTITLASAPSSQVNFTATSSNSSVVTVGTPSVGTSSFNDPVSINLTGVGGGSATVTHTISTSDASYSSASVASVSVSVSIEANVRVTPTELSLTEGGDNGSYEVVLAVNPGGTVTVTPTSSDESAASVTAVLSFNSGNWSIPQTVTVSPVDDVDLDDEEVTITHAVTGLSGVTTAPPVTVTVADDDRLSSISVSTEDSISEGDAAIFVFTADPPPNTDMSIPISIEQDGAYVSAEEIGDAVIEFETGESTVNFSRQTLNDEIDEPNGSLTVTITAPTNDSNYVVDEDSGDVNLEVIDNDATTVTLEVPSDNIEEADGQTTITITLSRALSDGEVLPVPIAFTGSATLGEDYTLVASATAADGVTYESLDSQPIVTFTGGETASATTVLTLIAIDDATVEGDGESVSIALGTLDTNSGTGLGGGATGSGGGNFTILDDDEPAEANVSAVQTQEDGRTVIEVVVNLGTAAASEVDLPINVLLSGEVIATGVLTIETGSTEGTTEVMLPEGSVESGDMVSVTFGELPSDVVAGSSSSVDVEVQVTEPERTMSLSAAQSVDEGQNISINFRASRALESDTTIMFSVSQTGSYLADDAIGDFSVDMDSGGLSTTFILVTQDNALDEPNGSVSVTLADPGADSGFVLATDGTASVSVIVTDSEPTGVTLTVPTASINEAAGTAEISVSLSRALVAGESLPVTLDFSGTATLGSDYQVSAPSPAPAQVTFSSLDADPLITFNGGDNAVSSASLTLTTIDDDANEQDGETVTVGLGTLNANSGTGLGGGANGSGGGTFTISDDDSGEPVTPEVGVDIDQVLEIEGFAVTVTVNLTATLATDVTIPVEIQKAGETIATASITVVAGRTSTTSQIELPEDDVSAGDSLTVVLGQLPDGVDASSANSTASVTLQATEPPPPVQVKVSVSDARAIEGGGEGLIFTVSLDPAADMTVTVDWETQDGTATAGVDYVSNNGSLTFASGVTSQMVQIEVLQDTIEEPEETMKLLLVSATMGILIEDGEGEGVIENFMSSQDAWASRLGRTISDHVVGGISSRIENQGVARSLNSLSSFASDGSQDRWQSGDSGFKLAGYRLEDIESSERLLFLDETVNPSANSVGFDSTIGLVPAVSVNQRTGRNANPGSRGLYSDSDWWRKALGNSGFSLNADGNGRSFGIWGRGSWSSFEGVADEQTLDGDVSTAQLGLDVRGSSMLVGLSISQSQAEGTNMRAGGQVSLESSMTVFAPYAGISSNRFSAWLTSGRGTGELEVKPSQGMTTVADTEMTLNAAGARGELLGSNRAFGIALIGDLVSTLTTVDATDRLLGGESKLNRSRFAVEISLNNRLSGGGQFATRLEGGVRNDFGDAEEGSGAEIAGSLAWISRGLTAEIEARGLATHKDSNFKQQGVSVYLAWDSSPNLAVGPTLALRQRWGIETSSGLRQLFALQRNLQYGFDRPTGGLEAELAWDFPLQGGQFVGSPYLINSAMSNSQEYGIGWRLRPLSRDNISLDIRTSQFTDFAQESSIGIKFEGRLFW